MTSIQNYIIRFFLRRRMKENAFKDYPITALRKGFLKLTKAKHLPSRLTYERVDIDGIDGEWVTPDDLQTEGVILYFHGGGYVMGAIETHQILVGNIAREAKTKALSINYSLAPENPFPAALDEAVKSYNWLITQGYDHNKIIIAGDSAGGGLALATIVRLRDENTPLPKAGMLLSPWLDLESTGESLVALEKKDVMVTAEALRYFGKMYAGEENIRHPHASLLYADPKGLPPLFIQVSDAEVLLDDTLRFAKKAKAAGVTVEVDVWRNMIHVWQHVGKRLPEAVKAIKLLGNFVYNSVK